MPYGCAEPLTLRASDCDYPLMFPECIECRGVRGMCGIDPCPLLSEIRGRLPQTEPTSLDDMSGPSPPSLFVGRYGYPSVRAGLSASWAQDSNAPVSSSGDPSDLFGKPLEEVAARHAHLVTGGRNMPISSPCDPGPVLEATQVIAMASGPVDVEMDFNRPVPIGGSPTFDSMSTPLGPSGEVVRAEVVSHASIPRKVDSVTGETDLLASDAMEELTASGIGEAHVSRILSSGRLGKEGNRRLVPTRWGITATDDTLSKQRWERVRDMPSLDKVLAFDATYLDNRFHVILTPGPWAFHMLEAWCQGSVWATHGRVLEDWEDLEPRTEYAHSITGAYYATRLAVLEYMERIGRSGACLVWRDIGPEYWAPVGVWLIRETVREAMKRNPRVFDTINEAVSHVAPRISSPDDLRGSWFVNRRRQTRLDSF